GALKLGGQGLHFIARNAHFLRRRCGFALGVVGVGGEAEADYPFVRLLGMGVELRQASEVAENNRQDSRGGGVESAEMSHRALANNPPHAIDYVVRREAGRLVDDYDTIHGDL